MKILHVIVGLYDGGAESSLYRIVKEDKQFDHVIVSLMETTETREKYVAVGAVVVSLGMKRGRLTPGAMYRLGKAIRKEQPDAIQTWMYHSDLIGGLVGYLLGYRNIVWEIRHSNLNVNVNKLSTVIIARVCAVLSYLIPKKIVSCSHAATLVHCGIGYKKSKFVHIPNGFNLSDL